MKTKRFPIVLATILLTTVSVVAQIKVLDPSADRLQKDVSYLASDALEGRRAGTAGADKAARYLAAEMKAIGLRSMNKGDSKDRYLQQFPYVAGVELGKENSFSFGKGSLQPGVEWLPLGFSTNAKVEGAPVFVGYGITASELNHDDYAGVNANGKIAIALQGTPDGNNPHGKFFRFVGVRWKAIAARSAGAKALILVTRDASLKDDHLTKLTYDNQGGGAGLPVVVVSRQGLDKFLALANTSVSKLEADNCQGHDQRRTGEHRNLADHRCRAQRSSCIQRGRRA